MAEPSAESSPRRLAILEAALGVFARYGFKKTSMDDLARAAGLSRQGLYLHYPTKESLFRAATLAVVERIRTAGEGALRDEERDVEARLVGAYEAMHGALLGTVQGDHMDELIETAAELLGPVVPELEEAMNDAVVALLKKSGIAGRWKDAGVSAKDLAAHLDAVSKGLKHSVADAAAYRARMAVAVKIVCRGRA